METQSQMSKFGNSQFGQSMSNVSQIYSTFGTSSLGTANIKFLNNQQQNKIDQLDSQKAYMQAKKKKENEAARLKEEKKNKQQA